MPFGQVVIGPPGSGKTTYCNGMQQFLQLLGRKTAVINLDPANDHLPYECAVNVEDLIRLEDVMEQHTLGPNGGTIPHTCKLVVLIFFESLKGALFESRADHYLLFDFPGQVELFTLHSNAKNILQTLIKKFDLRLSVVHLIDSHLCCAPHKYLSALLLALHAMLHLELPHVNVLSKIDLLESYGKLEFDLEYYTEARDLSDLQQAVQKDMSQKYRKLSAGLCEVVEDFALLTFETLNIQDKESVYALVNTIDKSNGYVFAGAEGNAQKYSQIGVGPTNDLDHSRYPINFT